jgi:general secretion pathway protein B
MSSILKALKKLEQEKARRDLPPDLNREIVQSGRGRTAAWRTPAALAATAAVAVLVTYAVMGGFSARKTSAPAPQPGTAASPPVTAPAAAPPTATPSVPAPAASPAPPAPAPKAAAAAPATPRPVAPPRIAKAVPTKPEQKQGQEERVIPVIVATPPPVIEAPRPTPSPPPRITVSGIAYQKNGVLRLAVVNGAPVKEGADVDGARVEEILPDRVKFSREGKKFEVTLERSDR